MEFKDRGGGFTITIDNRTLYDRLQGVLVRQAKEKFDIKLLSCEALFVNENGELYIWDRTRPYSSDYEKPIPEAQKWFSERLAVIQEILQDANN